MDFNAQWQKKLEEAVSEVSLEKDAEIERLKSKIQELEQM
jgi:hypothetical protein